MVLESIETVLLGPAFVGWSLGRRGLDDMDLQHSHMHEWVSFGISCTHCMLPVNCHHLGSVFAASSETVWKLSTMSGPECNMDWALILISARRMGDNKVNPAGILLIWSLSLTDIRRSQRLAPYRANSKSPRGQSSRIGITSPSNQTRSSTNAAASRATPPDITPALKQPICNMT